MSKANSGLRGTFPLQTRAFFLSPELMRHPEQAREHVTTQLGRGYNVVVLPVLYEGNVLFRAGSDGTLRVHRKCPSRDILTILRNMSCSVWLLLDLLTAGPEGQEDLGPLADRHRDWLMKNYHGGFEVLPGGRTPGLFCWTSLDYRRFVGNLLVEIVEAYPVDGFLFDVRNLPRTTTEPETWMHLGYSCLRRIQRELDVDLEVFLDRPSLKMFNSINQWRMAEFAFFIENIKARAQKSRELPVCLLANLGDPEDPYLPWGSSLAKGIIDEAALRAEPADVPRHVAALDRAVGDERPFLIALRDEKPLEELAAALMKVPATGYLVMRPDAEKEDALPAPPALWRLPGALESNPITAALTMMDQVFAQLDPSDPLNLFYRELESYLSEGRESLRFEEVLKVRDEVNVVRKRIAEEGDAEGRGELLRHLDFVARLLLLAPAPPVAS